MNRGDPYITPIFVRQSTFLVEVNWCSVNASQRFAKGLANKKAGDDGGHRHLLINRPRPRAESSRVDYLRGLRGRVRSGAGFTSPGCTVGVGAGGCVPGGHNQISK